jgi:hypothetical protein
VFVASLLAAWSGCEGDDTPRIPPHLLSAAQQQGDVRGPLPSRSRVEADPRASPASSALIALREFQLELKPRRFPAQRLAFAGGRIARLAQEAVVVVDTSDFASELTFFVRGPQRVISLKDGSLAVVAETEVLRLPVGAQQPESYARVPLFAETLLFPDRRQATRVWLLHGFDPTLYGHRLEAATSKLPAPESFHPLRQFDHRAFAAIKDGSFVYTSGDKLHRFFPEGKQQEYRLPPHQAPIWRILPTRRIDRCWLAYRDGQLALVQLGRRLRVVRTFQISFVAFDATSNDRHLAFIRLEQQPHRPRQWSLVLVDQHGKQQHSFALPADATSAEPDWAKRVTQDKCVALARRAPLVAVGGSAELRVWNLRTGAVHVFPQSPAGGGQKRSSGLPQP